MQELTEREARLIEAKINEELDEICRYRTCAQNESNAQLRQQEEQMAAVHRLRCMRLLHRADE